MGISTIIRKQSAWIQQISRSQMVFEARSMRTELIKASFTTLDIIQELVEEWLCNIIGSGMTCVVRKVQGILDNTLNLLEFVNHGLQLTHDPSMHANAAFFFLEIFRATTYKSNSYKFKS